MDEIHGGYLPGGQMLEADGEVGIRSRQGKCGCRTLVTMLPVSLPIVESEQRIRFAIACAWQIYQNMAWRIWAKNWIDGTDRSISAREATL